VLAAPILELEPVEDEGTLLSVLADETSDEVLKMDEMRAADIVTDVGTAELDRLKAVE